MSLGKWLSKRRAGIRWRIEMVKNRMFDYRFGTDTGVESDLQAEGVPEEKAKRGRAIYRSIWASEFRNWVSKLPIAPGEYTFVDYGSGKGKVLLLAAEYGFRKILGVEYAPGLHTSALENIKSYSTHTKSSASIVALNGDALDFELPIDPVVCFIFNAFDEGITRQVVRNIEASYRSHPRKIYLLYLNRRAVAEIGDAFEHLENFKPIFKDANALIFVAGDA